MFEALKEEIKKSLKEMVIWLGLLSMFCFHWLINKETAWPDMSEHRWVE